MTFLGARAGAGTVLVSESDRLRDLAGRMAGAVAIPWRLESRKGCGLGPSELARALSLDGASATSSVALRLSVLAFIPSGEDG